MKEKFIITKDKDTAAQLFAAGFILVSNMGGVCTFLNDPPAHFNFAQLNSQKMQFSNTLCV